MNDHHLTELLRNREGLRLSRQTVQRLLRSSGIGSPRTRRPPRHRSRRERMPQAGLLVQMDGSHHPWLEDRGPRLVLHAAIDDATSQVLGGVFRLEEDAHGYFLLLRQLIRRYGLPTAAYTDRHGIFHRDPRTPLTLAEQLQGRPASTQVGRALQELGIRWIGAHSPQAKGRVERLFGTFQDRLVSELRLAQARTLSQAQRVLDRFLPRYNARFTQAPAPPSRDARQRLRWMEFYEAHGHNARLTCRRFGISSATFYRWRRRYNPRRLSSLEDDRRTRRPRRVRQPQSPAPLVGRIRALQEAYPRWGKAKLAVLLAREGWKVSASTVGRTLGRLRAMGQLREPGVVKAQQAKRHRRRQRRRHAQRKPWEYVVRAPGDLVQIDTTPVEVRPGLRRVHFTARDVVSRADVLAAHDRGSSRAAERVLREAFPRFGFPVRAIQIDGGSEFKAVFEAACERMGFGCLCCRREARS